jgi:ELWxxDGT repeat protein
LWQSDGTPEGTTPLYEFAAADTPRNPRNLTIWNDDLVFIGDTATGIPQLWRVNIGHLEPLVIGNVSPRGELVAVGETLLFAGDDAATGVELWSTDGTEAGTRIVQDIRIGVGSSSPSEVRYINGTVVFRANDGIHGVELWKSADTLDDAEMVYDINPGSGHSTPYNFVSMNDRIYFVAATPETGRELWSTDGTDGGTSLVKDLFPTGDGIRGGMVNVQNRLYFWGTDALGTNVWSTDGTETDTQRITSFTTAQAFTPIVGLNDIVYFSADDGIHGQEIWSSNGDLAQTAMLIDINGGTMSSEGRDGGEGINHWLTVSSPGLFFVANDNTQLAQLYHAPNVDSPASPVLTPSPIWPTRQAQDRMTSAQDYVILSSATLVGGDFNTTGPEPIRSDGTPSGTYQLKDIYPASPPPANEGSLPRNFSNAPQTNIVYFVANSRDAMGPFQGVFRTDGTDTGTAPVAIFRESIIQPIKAITATLTLFSVHNLDGTHELWRTDGTSEGTYLIADVHANGDQTIITAELNGIHYFSGTASDNSSSGLWRTDGTVDGTYNVQAVSSFASISRMNYLTTVNDMLYFIADDGIHGTELWKSDGTDSGTQLVRDIAPNQASSFRQFSDGIATLEDEDPRSLIVALNGILYFGAFDGNDFELWRSDGTTSGTYLLKNIDPLPGNSSGPRHLTVVEDRVYFSASRSDTGREVWVTDGTAEGTVLAFDVAVGPGSSRPHNFVEFDGRVVFSATTDDHGTEVWYSPIIPNGDFSLDERLTAEDLDLLVSAIAMQTDDGTFDMNGDGIVTTLDVNAWLRVTGRVMRSDPHAFVAGDADLDGIVDANDYGAWSSNRFRSLRNWTGGDFNADGATDATDFNIWNSNKFRESTRSSASQIDEARVPRSAATLTVALLDNSALLSIKTTRFGDSHEQSDVTIVNRDSSAHRHQTSFPSGGRDTTERSAVPYWFSTTRARRSGSAASRPSYQEERSMLRPTTSLTPELIDATFELQ